MQTINPVQNTGVIISPVRDSDLKVGSINPSVFNTAGDWRQFECDGEWQKDMTISFDTEACMSFTGTNLIATYLNWLMINGYLLAPQMAFLKENGYIGSDGKVMLSPRFTATMSHTTVNGNDFQNVWDSIANDGVVPDSVWPMPTAAINADSAQAWSLYYANVSADAIALGKQFLSFFTIPWEWLVSDGSGASQQQFAQWLEVSPIHIAIAVCNPWNTASPIAGCGSGAAHGVLLTRVETGVVNNILDHYVPFDKQLEANYTLSYAVRAIVTQIPQIVTPTAPTPAQTVAKELPLLQQDINNLKYESPAQRTQDSIKISQILKYLLQLIGVTIS
jgi:hypothetical protein